MLNINHIMNHGVLYQHAMASIKQVWVRYVRQGFLSILDNFKIWIIKSEASSAIHLHSEINIMQVWISIPSKYYYLHKHVTHPSITKCI